jgi:hypothetical protein
MRTPLLGRRMYSHDSCTEHECTTNNINTDDYQMQHIADDCHCTSLKPAVGSIIESLQNNQVPLLQILGDEDSECKINVVPFDVGKNYVAISHVWSDGLGSTTEVGLPLCQICRISKLVAQVLPESLFWMDSLCVPSQRDMRKRAIGLMAQTYSQAKIVIVLDSGIRACSLQAPLEEKLLQVIASGWMHRLWTVQEALLAESLIFEFSNGLVNVLDLIPSGEELFDPLLMDLASEVFRLRSYKLGQGYNISDVSRALTWRTTSRREDETLAVCGLLGVDAGELVSLKAEERMRAFLLRIGKLPRSIVFLIAPRLNQDNFRWAPNSLMTKTDVTLWKVPEEVASSAESANCTEEGLFAKFSAVYFDRVELRADKPDWLVILQRQELYLKLTSANLMSHAGTPDTYECNSLLFTTLPSTGSIAICIAVMIKPRLGEEKDRKESRFLCQYKMRLLARRLGERERSKAEGDVIVARGGGGINVLMI